MLWFPFEKENGNRRYINVQNKNKGQRNIFSFLVLLSPFFHAKLKKEGEGRWGGKEKK